MNTPRFIDLNGARKVLSEIGIDLTQRQMKRAADVDAHGKRKLPFFIDPIDKRRKIEKGVLLEIYNQCQAEAENNTYAKVFNAITATKSSRDGGRGD